jgi:hypothetical protein
LKAVTMGVVASIDFFGQMWPTQPHASNQAAEGGHEGLSWLELQ